jgi:hypothetical protein
MTGGPYLYDDEPAPLHTGTPRRRNGLLLAIFGGTALLAVLLVVALPLLRGSAGDQARETAGVFLAALEQNDTETAHLLLCDKERTRVKPGDVAHEYLGAGAGRVVSATEGEVDGEPVQRVEVRWADGATSEWTVINESGAHICGTAPGE